LQQVELVFVGAGNFATAEVVISRPIARQGSPCRAPTEDGSSPQSLQQTED
jgi:hypothetical protein